ncbi:MAG: glycosyltransferase family 2 protein [Bacteroidetes bacterium]|nr:glycosyltransferase family 2 protein [Bacteroidota bacterium]
MASITIGMPVYNDKNFIEASIKSILAQTFTDFNLIIADDCSSDGSADICLKYAAIDSRITYIKHKNNIGISQNMKFLLMQARTDFFMWAADDDLWSTDYVETLLNNLKQSKTGIVSFCTFATIDEANNIIKDQIDFDYHNENVRKRLTGFIRNANDAFGYGIFRTDQIQNVEFPIWWWPNRKCAYNNIYPTLCYYLAKGDYIHCAGVPRFFNRIKSTNNINHILPYKKDGIKELLAYILRKMNLVCFSFLLIYKTGKYGLAIITLPTLLYYWFLAPSLQKIKHFFKKAKGDKTSY